MFFGKEIKEIKIKQKRNVKRKPKSGLCQLRSPQKDEVKVGIAL